MPKLKTKSSTKGRFRVTAKGKVLKNFAGKRHMMRRRSQSMIRKSRGTEVMSAVDAKKVRSYMPYGR